MWIRSLTCASMLVSFVLFSFGCQTANNSSAVLDQTEPQTPDRFVCSMTNTAARPFFTFIFKLSGDRVSMSYVASAFFGSEEMQVEQLWNGMNDMPAYWPDGRRTLSFEGDGDGDAGFGKITFADGRWTGWVHFPEGGPEGTPEDERIDVGCRAEQTQTGGDTGDNTGDNSGATDGRFVCGMADTNARPYFTFILKTLGDQVSLSYLRSAFFGSEEMQYEQAWEGMSNMPADWQEGGRTLVFEGDGDGDGGYGEITNFQGIWSGWLHFPEGGPEGAAEDERINVGCRRES